MSLTSSFPQTAGGCIRTLALKCAPRFPKPACGLRQSATARRRLCAESQGHGGGRWRLKRTIRLSFGEPAPTDCKHSVSGTISLPSSGCFSPFPHGTSALSVAKEYLGLEGGPPTFRQDFTCPALLKDQKETLPVRGYHPLWPDFPDGSGFL